MKKKNEITFIINNFRNNIKEYERNFNINNEYKK